MGATAATIVMEEFGKACAGSTLSYLAHTILCVNNLNNNGSADQKSEISPETYSGEHVGCMGMSEPEYGSDAVGMQTKAVKMGDHYEITGNKMWITNAQFAGRCLSLHKNRHWKERPNNVHRRERHSGFHCFKRNPQDGNEIFTYW